MVAWSSWSAGAMHMSKDGVKKWRKDGGLKIPSKCQRGGYISIYVWMWQCCHLLHIHHPCHKQAIKQAGGTNSCGRSNIPTKLSSSSGRSLRILFTKLAAAATIDLKQQRAWCSSTWRFDPAPGTWLGRSKHFNHQHVHNLAMVVGTKLVTDRAREMNEAACGFHL